ncbi:hypothetical protein RY831_26850 [Noviherbaspirillum sp. CPCC 100848]|uniref:Lipoprotein n=1 Tax=Noviherbaspirillum album TaxID=3080276 RepID=A0ABU6JGJ6_9BURK|nr:hypothetical protein [Noviherbaspirillum sp. CPCC 100848]MEC4722784.1 hypothetical protein [Noviherbaspirillum sp. CPCC 100848]
MNIVTLAAALVVVLSGCEGMSRLTDPNKITLDIDGQTISVLFRNGKWESFPDGWKSLNGVNYVTLRRQQIRAIETTSGCRVIASEYVYGTLTLQTEVECGAKK